MPGGENQTGMEGMIRIYQRRRRPFWDENGNLTSYFTNFSEEFGKSSSGGGEYGRFSLPQEGIRGDKNMGL